MSSEYEAACEVRDAVRHVTGELEQLNQHLGALSVMARVFLEWYLVADKPLEGNAPGLKKKLLGLLERLMSIDRIIEINKKD